MAAEIASSKYKTLQSVQADLLSDKITCKDLVTYYLGRIEASKHLNAYVEIYESEALKCASELDEKFRTNPESVGKLFGMVIAIKDVICYANATT